MNKGIIENMGKQNKRSKGRKIDNQVESKEQLIEMHAEAYYRALKRIKEEQSEETISLEESKKTKKIKDILFYINVVFWPWKIGRRFRVNNHIYDSILSVVISCMFKLFGLCLWLFGIYAIPHGIVSITLKIPNAWLLVFPVSLALMMWGSIFIIAGKEFEKEKDSNIIYAYSASILALISCLLSLVTLLQA